MCQRWGGQRCSVLGPKLREGHYCWRPEARTCDSAPSFGAEAKICDRASKSRSLCSGPLPVPASKIPSQEYRRRDLTLSQFLASGRHTRRSYCMVWLRGAKTRDPIPVSAWGCLKMVMLGHPTAEIATWSQFVGPPCSKNARRSLPSAQKWLAPSAPKIGTISQFLASGSHTRTLAQVRASRCEQVGNVGHPTAEIAIASLVAGPPCPAHARGSHFRGARPPKCPIAGTLGAESRDLVAMSGIGIPNNRDPQQLGPYRNFGGLPSMWKGACRWGLEAKLGYGHTFVFPTFDPGPREARNHDKTRQTKVKEGGAIAASSGGGRRFRRQR